MIDDEHDKDDNTNNSIDDSGWSEIYYYSVPFSSITSGLSPASSHFPSQSLSGWLIRVVIVSPLPNTPPPHTSAAAHTSWTVSNSKPEQSRALVNAVITARIGPIPHNLVCTWHLALNHRVWGFSERSICQQSSNIALVQLKRVNRHLIICACPLKLFGCYSPIVMELPWGPCIASIMYK